MAVIKKKFSIPDYMREGGLLHSFYLHLQKHKIEVRLVGGCLRDYLDDNSKLKTAADYDLAIDASPDKLIESLKNTARYKHYMTGIDHGTVTVYDTALEGSFEVTSLRVDETTYGRKADVKFIGDWSLDAERRDFTFNAMSMDFNGYVYDYFDGIKDLEDKRIKFVGNAEKRIKEDYLRILRFFRFFSTHAESFVAEELEAIYKLKEGMNILAKERIGKEMRLLLQGKKAWESINLMEQGAVLDQLLGSAKSPTKDTIKKESLAGIYAEKKYLFILRLYMLTKEKPNIKEVINDLKLSRWEGKALAFLIDPQERILARALHRTEDKHLLAIGQISYFLENKIDLQQLKNNLKVIDKYQKTAFPLSGDLIKAEVIKAGLSKSEIGKKQQLIEDWWIDNKLTPSADDCLNQLKKILLKS